MSLLNVVLDSTKKCELTPDTSKLVYLYAATVSPCGDPNSWTSYDGLCYYRTIITPAIPPSTTIHTVIPATYSAYSDLGTKFYEPGYAIDGSGTNTLITTDVIWRNNNDINGPLNRSDIWTNIVPIGSQDQPINKWVGVVACLTGVTTSKTYYIGIAADNEYKLLIDGNLILDSYYYLGGFDSSHHRYWHMYPISILAGQHQIHLFGMNRSDRAAFGCEIYDNTYSELTGATSGTTLNVIFSSRTQSDVKLIQLANGTYTNEGYTCTTGSYLACNNTCVDIEICCPSGITTTTTTTSATTTTTTTLAPTSVNIWITNAGNYVADTITSVTVNDINITEVTFPVNSGVTLSGQTNQIGTYTIQVGYTIDSTAGIECQDSYGIFNCENVTGIGTISFISQVIGGGDIYIILHDEPCL